MTHPMPTPTQTAEAVCHILSARYPDGDYAFDHGDAEDFFEGYYDVGLPFDPFDLADYRLTDEMRVAPSLTRGS